MRHISRFVNALLFFSNKITNIKWLTKKIIWNLVNETQKMRREKKITKLRWYILFYFFKKMIMIYVRNKKTDNERQISKCQYFKSANTMVFFYFYLPWPYLEMSFNYIFFNLMNFVYQAIISTENKICLMLNKIYSIRFLFYALLVQ